MICMERYTIYTQLSYIQRKHIKHLYLCPQVIALPYRK